MEPTYQSALYVWEANADSSATFVWLKSHLRCHHLRATTQAILPCSRPHAPSGCDATVVVAVLRAGNERWHIFPPKKKGLMQ